jgi:hypothetical protein
MSIQINKIKEENMTLVVGSINPDYLNNYLRWTGASLQNRHIAVIQLQGLEYHGGYAFVLNDKNEKFVIVIWGDHPRKICQKGECPLLARKIADEILEAVDEGCKIIKL